MKKLPSSSICRATEPRALSVNWGRKARKNSATLGLVTFMMMPENKVRVPRAGMRADFTQRHRPECLNSQQHQISGPQGLEQIKC